MSKNLFNRYIWIVDTIRRYGRISRRQLDEEWVRSSLCEDGKPMARRTFFNYREMIAEIFNIEICCDGSTFEYYIKGDEVGGKNHSVTSWLLTSASISDMLSDSRDIADRIYLEENPSATYLTAVVRALRMNQRMTFTYHPFYRSQPTPGVLIEPYLLKVFRQRWYVAGYNVADKMVKTYSLDRMSDVRLLTDTFAVPYDFDGGQYFKDSFGIVVTQGEAKRVVLRASPLQAKYLRALPLHHSQSEMVTDQYSLFSYRLRLTRDLVEELLRMGPEITVLEPMELRAMVTDSLRQSLANYATLDKQ